MEFTRFHRELFTREYAGEQIVDFPLVKMLSTKSQVSQGDFTSRFRNKQFPTFSSTTTPTADSFTVDFMHDCWRKFDIAPSDLVEYELYGGSFGEENSDGHLRLYVHRGRIIAVNRQSYVADW